MTTNADAAVTVYRPMTVVVLAQHLAMRDERLPERAMLILEDLFEGLADEPT